MSQNWLEKSRQQIEADKLAAQKSAEVKRLQEREKQSSLQQTKEIETIRRQRESEENTEVTIITREVGIMELLEDVNNYAWGKAGRITELKGEVWSGQLMKREFTLVGTAKKFVETETTRVPVERIIHIDGQWVGGEGGSYQEPSDSTFIDLVRIPIDGRLEDNIEACKLGVELLKKENGKYYIKVFNSSSISQRRPEESQMIAQGITPMDYQSVEQDGFTLSSVYEKKDSLQAYLRVNLAVGVVSLEEQEKSPSQITARAIEEYNQALKNKKDPQRKRKERQARDMNRWGGFGP